MSGFMDEHERARRPLVTTRWESPRAPVHGVSLHDEGAEVAPTYGAWSAFVGRDVWVEWRDRGWDWYGQRVEGFASVRGEFVGLMLRAIDYRDADMGGWCCVSDADQVHEAAWADIESIRLLTDEERRPPEVAPAARAGNRAQFPVEFRDGSVAGAQTLQAGRRESGIRDSRPANEPARLSLPGDSHYSVLPIGPLEVTEKWAPHWPSPSVVYPLGEALAMIARCGTRGQAVRDLRKAAGLLAHAADFLERES